MARSDSQPVSIVLVAIGGYGGTYLNALLDGPQERPCRIAGVVDPYAERSARLGDVQAQGIPVFPALDEFYAEHAADLVVISSPIHLHAAQTCAALEHGSHVLCEKPAAATVQDVQRMIAARDRAGRTVGIGYQLSFHPGTHQFKEDIRAGLFGRPLRLKAMALWPRDEQYYGRNNWAGRQKADNGAWVLDSPVNNANAHYLHHMLYVLGERADRSAQPVDVTAELYRANAIENYDTAALRVHTCDGVEILFIASHAVQGNIGPVFEFEFERAVLRSRGGEDVMTATFQDGRTRSYGTQREHHANKLWNLVAAARGEEEVLCGLEAAGAQTLAMNGAQESAALITSFAEDRIAVAGPPGERLTHVPGLSEDLQSCFAEWKLPHEQGLAWARPGRTVDLTAYAAFPSTERE